MKRVFALGAAVFFVNGGCGAGPVDPAATTPSTTSPGNNTVGADAGGNPGNPTPAPSPGPGPGPHGGGADGGSAADASPIGTPSDAGSADSGPIVPPPGWTLLWSDEFDGADGSDVDPTKWIHDVGDGSNTTEGTWNPGNGWGNDELEYYTAGTANTQQEGGYLILTATKNADPSLVCQFADDPNSANTTYHSGTCEYTSGRIKTVLGPQGTSGPLRQNLFSHLYGRFEMRAQIPPGVGMWPAFWMMGTNLFRQSWPACGELDIMEEIGDEPGTVYGTSHSTASGDTGVRHSFKLPGGANLSDAFHVYAIEWTPTTLTWFLDDTAYGTETAPAGATTSNWPFTDPNNPYFIILNLAVSSGDANSWGAAPTAATVFPAQMKVDYVRVYEASNGDQ
jgi:beta-glucanase (GH16 family)